MMGPVLLGHQGGWDEILFVLTPIALFAALLVVANKRAGRLADEEEQEEQDGTEERADDDRAG